MFWYVDGLIEERTKAGVFVDTFDNEFLASTKDGLLDTFGLYAQTWQAPNIYTLTNLRDAQKVYIELNKANLERMFALLSTFFQGIVSTWAPPEGHFGDFSGTVPHSAFFTENHPLFTFESPRKTWSHGE